MDPVNQNIRELNSIDLSKPCHISMDGNLGLKAKDQN